MADPIRAAYERAFTGSNRTAATWAAFRAGWHAATRGVPASSKPLRWHELKTDPDVFDAVAAGRKTFEIRKDDRGYQEGDGLHLRRTKHTGRTMSVGMPLIYTGEECRCVVTHILRGPVYGLADGWAILSIKPYGVQEVPRG